MRTLARLTPFLLITAAVAAAWYAIVSFLLPPTRHGLRYDPIEDDARAKPIIAAVEEEVSAITANDPPELKLQFGYCHRVWGLKKHLLQKKHGIEWRTPAEMNPRVAFD